MCKCVITFVSITDERNRIPPSYQVELKHMRGGWCVDGFPFLLFGVFEVYVLLSVSLSGGSFLICCGLE